LAEIFHLEQIALIEKQHLRVVDICLLLKLHGRNVDIDQELVKQDYSGKTTQ
jgi:hypothetical protein